MNDLMEWYLTRIDFFFNSNTDIIRIDTTSKTVNTIFPSIDKYQKFLAYLKFKCGKFWKEQKSFKNFHFIAVEIFNYKKRKKENIFKGK
jgi:uncharacterized protein YfbU (UPF0304 family)